MLRDFNLLLLFYYFLFELLHFKFIFLSSHSIAWNPDDTFPSLFWVTFSHRSRSLIPHAVFISWMYFFFYICVFLVIVRQAVDGAHQGKMIGDSFPVNQNSKIKIAEQLRKRAGPCPDHRLLIPEVRRPPQPHLHRKAPWRSKGSDANWYQATHRPLR